MSIQDVKWLQTITSMPILVKGVITAEDSKQTIPLFFLIFFIIFNYLASHDIFLK